MSNKRIYIFLLLHLIMFACKDKPVDTDKDGIVDMVDGKEVDKCPTIKGDSINQGCPDIKKVNFFIETSASMNGYFNGITGFKDNLSTMISKIEGSIQPEMTDNVNIFFIDNADSAKLYKGSKSDFFHTISSTKISTGRSSELHNIFKKITDKNKLTDNSISILISDCILSYPPEDAVARKLVHMKRVICGTPAYFAAYGEPRTPHDLAHHTCFSLMLPDDSRVWRLIDGAGEEFSIPVSSKFNFNSVDCILDAVLAGHGLAILPTYLCGPALARGALKTVFDYLEPVSSIGRYLYACYTPNRVRVPKVRVFLAELEETFNPVPPWEKA